MAVALDWVEIPPGVLQRGTPVEQIDAVVAAHADLALPRSYFAKEAPRAEVHVPAFRIARTPVTCGQWAEWRRATGAQTAPADRLDHPVESVSWGEAVAYCAWLANEVKELIRLPTETEWERASRGDDGREYPWGDVFDPAAANLAEAGLVATTPVGSFLEGASPFGVLDLAGNVDEWTETVYAPYPDAPADLPPTEDWAADPHVTRGGGYQHCRDLARCARRHAVYPPMVGAGLRLAAS